MEKITLKISGADSNTFLQGLFTCDLQELNKTPLMAASCNQKGRIIANFWISCESHTFYLTLPKTMAPILQAHLKKYVFRSQVNLEPIDPPHAISTATVWILPETSEQFTPQMIDLEKQGGVSFTKGCYLGQEIIARTEHLGQLKRHLYQITLDNEITPQVGNPINNESGQKMGTVVAINNEGTFAVIEDRAIEQDLTTHGNSSLKIIKRPQES